MPPKDIYNVMGTDFGCYDGTIGTITSPTYTFTLDTKSEGFLEGLLGITKKEESKEKENKSMKQLQVKSIKYDKNYTTVTWTDETKTTVRCSDGDEYSRYDGFCSALAKKIFGTSSQVRKLVETKDEAIELAKKKAEQEEKYRIEEIKRNRKLRHQIKYRAKQIVIEKKAKELAKKMLGEEKEV